MSELIGDAANPEALTDDTRLAAIAELNERLADVAFELDAWPATLSALTRISLATGSACALIGFLTTSVNPNANAIPTDTPLMLVSRVAIAAVAGLAGAAVVLTIGRSAKVATRRIRADWDVSSRDIGKALGTSLAAVAEVRSIRGNRFPA